MNILFVCSSFGGGGAERVAANLATSFITKGHKSSIYYWDENSNQAYDIPPAIQLYKSKKRSLFSRIASLRKLLKDEHFDAIISFTDIANIISYFALTTLSVSPRFIATVHSDLKERDTHLHQSWFLYTIKFLHQIACRNADTVVAVSDGAKQSLIEYYKLKPDKVIRIYNPVLINNVSHQNKIVRKTINLVAAGRLTQAKNYPAMLQAVHLLKFHYSIPFHLSIYGDGELRTEIQDLIDQLDLQAEVDLKGFVINLNDKLSNHDIFLMTSSWEGFGNVLVEALNEGLHIIATNCPSGPAEILGNGKFGKLVAVNKPEEIAEAIIETSNTNAEHNAEELSKHLQQFTNEHIANQYLNLLCKN